MSERDVLGVVREHRWITAEEQADLLKPHCRMVVSLGGGKELLHVDRERLYKMAFPGRVLRFVHAFLLGDPTVRGTPQAKADFRKALKYLVQERSAVVECVVGELLTANAGHMRPMIALAEKMIGRSRQGAKSAENGKRGNQEAVFSKAAKVEAKAIWRDLIEYPTWDDCAVAFKALDKKYKHKDPFTVWRARLNWKKRTPAKLK